MAVNDDEIFECEVFHLKMPSANQPDWCAMKYRTAKEGDYCGMCPTGQKAAKENRTPGQGITAKIKKEIDMAEKKLCSCGCGKGAVKDGLATRCYKEKHGVAPFPSGQKTGSKPKKAPRGSGRAASGTKTPRKVLSVRPASSSSYHLEIDFTSYPKLHERLIDLSTKEHRSPDMQLVHMLDETFGQAEKRASK